MHSSAVLEVAYHGYVHAIYLSIVREQFLLDSVEIEESLRGMLVRAVTTVDNWHTTGLGKFANRAHLRVAHYYYIAVSAYNSGGVIERLAF